MEVLLTAVGAGTVGSCYKLYSDFSEMCQVKRIDQTQEWEAIATQRMRHVVPNFKQTRRAWSPENALPSALRPLRTIAPRSFHKELKLWVWSLVFGLVTVLGQLGCHLMRHWARKHFILVAVYMLAGQSAPVSRWLSSERRGEKSHVKNLKRPGI